MVTEKQQRRIQAILSKRTQKVIAPQVTQAQPIQPTPQVPQIYKIPRQGLNIYSFTNRSFMGESFMSEDPFMSSSPFFPKRRRL